MGSDLITQQPEDCKTMLYPTHYDDSDRFNAQDERFATIIS